MSRVATGRKRGLNLFRIAAINRRCLSFIVSRSNDDPEFAVAIEIDPQATSAYYKRGIANLQKRNLDQAISDLSRAIELSPNTADYYSDRGLVKLRKRDDDGAIADFTPAIELDPKAAQIAYRNRALARNLKGDADGAIADFTRNLAVAYKSRGEAKQAKGDTAGAKDDLKRAGELDPELKEEIDHIMDSVHVEE
ncbi:MAG: hypothetical protein DME61_04380 [Verrucomicrobia bacterium]|nr:MAG: hypothetical protein DME61_04380 [Verrucomicrobiota bacterium]